MVNKVVNEVYRIIRSFDFDVVMENGVPVLTGGKRDDKKSKKRKMDIIQIIKNDPFVREGLLEIAKKNSPEEELGKPKLVEPITDNLESEPDSDTNINCSIATDDIDDLDDGIRQQIEAAKAWNEKVRSRNGQQ